MSKPTFLSTVSLTTWCRSSDLHLAHLAALSSKLRKRCAKFAADPRTTHWYTLSGCGTVRVVTHRRRARQLSETTLETRLPDETSDERAMSAVSRMSISRQSGRLPREDQNHQPDHSALVGIGSNTGGLESACVSTSSIAAGQGHRLAPPAHPSGKENANVLSLSNRHAGRARNGQVPVR